MSVAGFVEVVVLPSVGALVGEVGEEVGMSAVWDWLVPPPDEVAPKQR